MYTYKMENTEKRARARSCNWDEEEKKLLHNLIQEEISIIECKETSTSVNNSKKASWKKVLQSFNTLNKRPRTLNQIITQWRNSKCILKSKNSEYNSKEMSSVPMDSGETFQPEILMHFEPEIDNNIYPACDSSRRESKSRDIRKMVTPKRKERDDDYEKQLFLLAKEARENAMKYALKEHQTKMEILGLEKQYWQNKLK